MQRIGSAKESNIGRGAKSAETWMMARLMWPRDKLATLASAYEAHQDQRMDGHLPAKLAPIEVAKILFRLHSIPQKPLHHPHHQQTSPHIISNTFQLVTPKKPNLELPQRLSGFGVS